MHKFMFRFLLKHDQKHCQPVKATDMCEKFFRRIFQDR